MPTCFERVVAVLNALGPQLPQNAQPAVSAALTTLRAAYRGLQNPGLAPIDYADITTQTAYVFGYLGANADLINRALCLDHAASQRVLNQPAVRIVAVGGGPGTELVGIYKYLDRHRCTCQRIEYLALDHHPTWQNLWPGVISTQPEGVTTTIAQVPFTIQGHIDGAALEAIAAADIVTFSYSLSETWRYGANGQVALTLDQIILALRPGALVLYSDNGGPNFDPHLDANFSQRQDITVLGHDRLSQMVGNDEEKSVLNQWSEWIKNGSPKLKGDATISLMEKRR